MAKKQSKSKTKPREKKKSNNKKATKANKQWYTKYYSLYID
jgi:hypothetical protein